MLYEDEMADNGITMLSCKIRVMPQRLLLLSRFFMRLDNVLVRMRDTRVYVDFGSGQIIREYQAREEKYETVRSVSHFLECTQILADPLQKLAASGHDAPAKLRDPNVLVELLPIIEQETGHLSIGLHAS